MCFADGIKIYVKKCCCYLAYKNSPNHITSEDSFSCRPKSTRTSHTGVCMFLLSHTFNIFK